MADALISQLIEQLTLLMKQQIQKEYRLVVGVNKEVRKLKSTLETVQAVLVDAENRQVQEAHTVQVWLRKLKNISYEMDDVLSEWSTEILKLQIKQRHHQTTKKKKKVYFSVSSPFLCFSFNRVVQCRDIALRIKDITESLDSIALEKDRYNFSKDVGLGNGEESMRHKSPSYLDVSEVCGRNEDMTTLVSKLCSESTSTNGIVVVRNTLQIISIVGLGGIGKTTLAQKAYQCDEVKNYFEKKMWVCVSEPFDQVRIAKAIVEEVEHKTPNVVELEATLRCVKNCIEGKKFLLVLDDVWTEDSKLWEPFKYVLRSGASGSTVLVTTRNEGVANMMEATYIHKLWQLSDQDCWSLFSRIALSEGSTQEYQDIGRQISDKCKGLPLAAKTIASLMRFKTRVEDWRSVLNSEIWDLEGAEKSLFPPLLLSYYELPSSIKRCFVYCANFPKDYSIEADNLIKLWMAQGYLINSKSSVDMEVTGRKYLDFLIVRSFFQDLEKDKGRDNFTRFKMHDMVHDFAQSFTKNECSIVNADSKIQLRAYSGCKKPRHLTLIRGDDSSFPKCVENTESLHTFWVQSFYDSPPIVSQVDAVPSSFFHRMRCLKALDLSRNRLNKLPKQVGEAMNLRYLNLSFNPLEELPESVGDLCNLQTLKLLSCNHLIKLPQEIGRLINLRHLEIDGTKNLRRLPEGVRELSALRTLSKFLVGGSGADAEEATCKLRDLKHLNDLRGCLSIEGLGNVTDASEAEEAELKKKEHLSKLYMGFNPLAQPDQITAVAEALQPHPSLTWLEMKFYGGTQFPSWMISLIHLKKLRLLDCQYCDCLPPLGRLPCLETLKLESMHNLKRINHTFLGLDGRVGGISAASISFPKLKKLKIVGLTCWEEWDVMSIGSEVNDKKSFMPSLHQLKLCQCYKLKALPDTLLQMAPLKRLRISDCPILQQRYRRGGDDWAKISHVSKVHIIGAESFQVS